jgi:hypothetical protein
MVSERYQLNIRYVVIKKYQGRCTINYQQQMLLRMLYMVI